MRFAPGRIISNNKKIAIISEFTVLFIFIMLNYVYREYLSPYCQLTFWLIESSTSDIPWSVGINISSFLTRDVILKIIKSKLNQNSQCFFLHSIHWCKYILYQQFRKYLYTTVCVHNNSHFKGWDWIHIASQIQ